MSDSGASRWKRVEAVVAEALSLEGLARQELLDRIASDDPGLRREAEELLRAALEAEGFLETPPLGHLSALAAAACHPGADGLRVGPYVLRELIGSGGMGAVYRAQRADGDIEQTVAIKIVRGSASPTRNAELFARFQHERQTLARLEHPNIARLLDAGTTEDGRLYYAMELVEGVPLDEYADALPPPSASVGRTPPRARYGSRLRLFAEVCSAVQAAHQQLIIHRDLKPGNILVTRAGSPKLLDFGLAKPLDAGEHARFVTAPGDFVGTFAYAAPEQIRGRPDDVDTRTDVYALGLILYRMLTGQHAHRLDGPLSLVLQRVAEDDPVTPSRLCPDIDDELNAIVLRAAAKSRDRRYSSVEALRKDVLAYLANEAVEARGDSGFYKLRKTIRRYRAPLTAGFVLTAFACLAALVMTAQARRTAYQRDRAVIAENQAVETAGRLGEALVLSDIERGRLLSLVGSSAIAEETLWRAYRAVRPEFHPGPSIPPEALLAPSGTGDPPLIAAAPQAYWALWEFYARQPCLATLELPASRAARVAVSPDGLKFAVGLEDGRIVAGNLDPQSPGSEFLVHTGVVHVIRFSADGKRFYSGDRAGVLAAWDLEENQLRWSCQAHDGPIRALAFSPDGLTVRTLGEDESLAVWDAVSGDRVRLSAVSTPPVGKNDAHSVYAASIASRNDVLVISYSDGSIAVWNFGGSEPELTTIISRQLGNAVALSPDGRWLASAGRDQLVRLWDCESGRQLAIGRKHTGVIVAIEFDDLQQRLITAGDDKNVVIWTVPDLRPVTTLAGHTACVSSAAFIPDQNRLVSVAYDQRLKLWESAPFACYRPFQGDGFTILSASVAPSGRWAVSAASSSPPTLTRWDLATGTPDWNAHGHTEPVSAVVVSPDGRSIASAGYDGLLLIWDAATGELMRTMEGHGEAVNDLAWTTDGRMLGSAGNDGSVCLWELPEGRLAARLENGTTRLPALAFSSDGLILAVARGHTGEVALWDITSRPAFASVVQAHEIAVRAVAFSPKGRVFASGGDDRRIRLWDATNPASPTPLATVDGHRQDIFSLAFSPNGRMLASASRDGEFKLWDVEKRALLATFEGPSSMLFSLDFAPDGRGLISAGADGALGYWDLEHYWQHLQGNARRYDRIDRSAGRGEAGPKGAAEH